MSETSDDAVCVKQPRSVFLGPVSMARLSFDTEHGPFAVRPPETAQHYALQIKEKSPASPDNCVQWHQLSPRRSDAPPCQSPFPDSELQDVSMPPLAPMPHQQAMDCVDTASVDSKLQAYPLCDVNDECQPCQIDSSTQSFQADESVGSLAGPRVAVAGALGSKDARVVQEQDALSSTGLLWPHLMPQPSDYARHSNRCSCLVERQTGFAPARHSPPSSLSPTFSDEKPGLLDGLPRLALAPLSSQLTRALEDTRKIHGTSASEYVCNKIAHAESPAEQSPAQDTSDGDWEVIESVDGEAENGKLGGSLGSLRDSVLRRFARLHSPQS
jgi:hypothetical protein